MRASAWWKKSPPRRRASRHGWLCSASHPLVGEARGMGLIGALELVADKPSKRAFPSDAASARGWCGFAEEEGLIVRAVGGDNITLCPPLIISEAEIDELFDRLTRALDRTLSHAAACL